MENEGSVKENREKAFEILTAMSRGLLVTNGSRVVHAVGMDEEGNVVAYGDYESKLTDFSKVRYSRPVTMECVCPK